MQSAQKKNPSRQLTRIALLLCSVCAFMFALSLNVQADHSSGSGCNSGYDQDCDGSTTAGGPYWAQDIDDTDPSIGGWNSPCGQFGCN